MKAGRYRVLLLMTVLICGEALAGKRVAVLVGANKGWKDDLPLRHAEEDARRLKAVLVELGGFKDADVVVLSTPNTRSILNALESARKKLAGSSSEETRFLFYYSGHADKDHLHLSGDPPLSFEELSRFLHDLPATVKIGIFDACHSGSILKAKGGVPTEEFDITVSGEATDVSGTIILTSSGLSEASLEARNAGSYFTHHLVSGLRGSADDNGDQRLSIGEAYTYAYRRTVADTSKFKVQRPNFRNDLKGNGNLYLTQLKSVSKLVFPRQEGSCFVITRDELLLIAEVLLRKDASVSLGLSPGEYKLLCMEEKKNKVASFELKADTLLEVDKLSFKEVPFSDGVLKGVPGRVAEALGTRLRIQAALIRTQQPENVELSVLLASESLRRNPSPEAHQELLHGLERLPRAEACFEQGSEVLAVAWSPNGEHLATTGLDKNVRLWSPKTNKEFARVSHDKTVVDLVWTPDGKHLTTRALQSDVVQWEARPGQNIAPRQRESPLHAVALDPSGALVAFMDQGGNLSVRKQEDNAEVLRKESMTSLLKFSAEGRFLAGLDTSGQVRVWDCTTWQEVLVTKPVEPSSRVPLLAVSPVGSFLALAQEGARVVQIWEVASGRQFSLPAHDGAVTALAFASANTLLTASEDKTVRLWDVATESALLRMPHPARVESLRVSPDGQWLATTLSEGPSAIIWNLRTGQELTRLAHRTLVKSVAWSPQGPRLATTSADGMTCVWGLTGEEVLQMPGWGRHTAMAFARKGQVLVTATEDEPACAWDIATGRKLACLDGQGGSNLLVPGPDGKRLATASGPLARVWDVSTGKEVSRMLHEGFIHALVFSPDGSVLATASQDGTVRVWDVSTGQGRSLMHDGPVKALAFSPDGKRLASGGEDQTVRIWELSTGKELLKLEHKALSCDAPSGPVLEACEQPYLPGTTPALEFVHFSPDGQYLATATLDAVVRVWDTGSGKELLHEPQPSFIRALAFTPDGKGLAIANGEPVVRIWDVATKQELASLEATNGVSFLQYSSDGKYLLTAGTQGTVSIWESSTRRELTRMLEGVNLDAILLSPDGRYLVTARNHGNGSGLLYSLYAWRPEDLIEQACMRLRRNLTKDDWHQYLGDTEPYKKTCPALP